MLTPLFYCQVKKCLDFAVDRSEFKQQRCGEPCSEQPDHSCPQTTADLACPFVTRMRALWIVSRANVSSVEEYLIPSYLCCSRSDTSYGPPVVAFARALPYRFRAVYPRRRVQEEQLLCQTQGVFH